MKQREIDFLYHAFLSVLTYGRVFFYEGRSFSVSPAGLMKIDGQPDGSMKEWFFDPENNEVAFKAAVEWTGKQMEEIASHIAGVLTEEFDDAKS